MKTTARKAFVVVERVQPQTKYGTLHIPETVAASHAHNIGRVVSSGPDVIGLAVDTVVVFGLGVQAEIDGLLYMRDDNVLATLEE